MQELLDWNEYVRLAVGLFALVDPLSAIPVFIGLTTSRTPTEKRSIAIVAAITVLATLLVFAFFGEAILYLFDITLDSFRIAGGILLLLLALEMMRSEVGSILFEDDRSGNAAVLGVVPLAIPLLAGPAAISTVIIYTHNPASTAHNLAIAVTILVVVAATFVLLRLAPVLGALFGRTGATVFNRIMGLIVAAIGIEFIIQGIANQFPALTVHA
jgi:multiple antibiotic resistance protein